MIMMPPDAGEWVWDPIFERQVERLMYSNGTSPLPLLLTLGAPLDTRCVYTLTIVNIVADPRVKAAMAPASPVKISHKKGGHIDFIFLGPPYPAAETASEIPESVS